MENTENCGKQHFCDSKTKNIQGNNIVLEYFKVKLIMKNLRLVELL